MKESQMKQPNSLGHYHRDIVKVLKSKGYYHKVLLTCNHTKWMSKQKYNKYKDHATLCVTCSQIEE